jgi:hypothetical protein
MLETMLHSLHGRTMFEVVLVASASAYSPLKLRKGQNDMHFYVQRLCKVVCCTS